MPTANHFYQPHPPTFSNPSHPLPRRPASLPTSPPDTRHPLQPPMRLNRLILRNLPPANAPPASSQHTARHSEQPSPKTYPPHPTTPTAPPTSPPQMRRSVQSARKHPQFYDLAKLVMKEQSNAIHKLAKTTDDKTMHEANLPLTLLQTKIPSL